MGTFRSNRTCGIYASKLRHCGSHLRVHKKGEGFLVLASSLVPFGCPHLAGSQVGLKTSTEGKCPEFF